MHRSILTAAAGITLGAGLLIPAARADAHHATVRISQQGCNPAGAFTGQLTITPTDMDKGPIATVRVNTSDYDIGTDLLPYSQLVTVMSGQTRTYHVSVRWNNGNTWGPQTVVLNPGETECTPTTTPAPTTTAPVVTTAPPGTIVTTPTTPDGTAPPVPTTTPVCIDGQPPTVPLEDGSVVCPEYGAPVHTPDHATTTTTAAVTGGQAGPPRTQAPPLALPATGGEVFVIVGTGLVLILCGISAVVIDRRKRAQAER